MNEADVPSLTRGDKIENPQNKSGMSIVKEDSAEGIPSPDH